MDYSMIPECVLIVGSSGCGKSHALVSLLKSEKRGVYDYVFILCPTFNINETCTNCNIKDPCVFGVSIVPEKLNKVITFIVKHFSSDARTAVVVDDMSNSSEQHNNFGELSYLAYSGRHHGISLYLLTQKLSSVATGVRDNTTIVLFFPTHCKRSLKTLRDEFFGNVETEGKEKALLESLRNRSTEYLDIDLIKRMQHVRKHR